MKFDRDNAAVRTPGLPLSLVHVKIGGAKFMDMGRLILGKRKITENPVCVYTYIYACTCMYVVREIERERKSPLKLS